MAKVIDKLTNSYSQEQGDETFYWLQQNLAVTKRNDITLSIVFWDFDKYVRVSDSSLRFLFLSMFKMKKVPKSMSLL